MPEHYTYILLGGGLTSAGAAQAIREIDPDGGLLIVGAEPYLPYDRPPLSKNLLQDPSLTVDDIASVDDGFYKKKNVRPLIGVTADSIDRRQKTVHCSDGKDYAYDKLLLATGSTPRTLKAEGSGVERVLYLRKFDDGIRLREALDEAKSAVLIGAGYISIEVAAACVAKGVKTTIIEPKEQVWSKFASKTMGGFLQRHFEKQGVQFALGDEVVRIDENGTQLTVSTKKGLTETVDIVLAGIGVSYNTEIAKAAGLDVDDKGRVRVDKTLRTEDPSIWAAGDYAVYFEDFLGTEFNAEHYMNAKWQGEHVGRNMAGASAIYSRVPYFFSDMGKLHMILRGKADDVEHTRIVGNIESEEFAELYPDKSGALKMAIAMSGSGDDVKLDKLANLFETLIKERTQVEEITESRLAV